MQFITGRRVRMFESLTPDGVVDHDNAVGSYARATDLGGLPLGDADNQ